MLAQVLFLWRNCLDSVTGQNDRGHWQVYPCRFIASPRESSRHSDRLNRILIFCWIKAFIVISVCVKDSGLAMSAWLFKTPSYFRLGKWSEHLYLIPSFLSLSLTRAYVWGKIRLSFALCPSYLSTGPFKYAYVCVVELTLVRYVLQSLGKLW